MSGSVRAITCPACGGAIEIKAVGYTVSLICQYCSSELDVANPDVRVITEYHEATAALDIPLGTRGTLKGVEWEAIGFLQKADSYTRWDEYLLFNPYHGYRWLTWNGSGWNFSTPLSESPVRSGSRSASWNGKNLPVFFRPCESRVEYVLGEFYWRVKKGEVTACSDYVLGRTMLSLEQSDKELNWTRGEWLPPAEVRAAFDVADAGGWSLLGRPPLPHQPSPYLKGLGTCAKMAVGAFFGALLISQIFGGGGGMVRQTFVVPLAGPEKSISAGTMTVDRDYQMITIEEQGAGFDNAWVDLDYDLVNRATQQSISGYGAVEAYSGRDSEGPWQESDLSNTIKFASVPRGTYDIMVEAKGNSWNWSPQPVLRDGQFVMPAGSEAQVTIGIERGGTFYSNVVLLLIALLIPLLWMTWLHARFERARLEERDSEAELGLTDYNWDENQ